MKNLLVSLLTVGLVSGAVWGSTSAFFSDTETSTGNILAAGDVDLTVASTAHYAGMVCTNIGTTNEPIYVWKEEIPSSSQFPDLINDPCDGTWTLSNLGQDTTFYNFDDLKPGDYGENTLTFKVTSNDAYMCATLDGMVDDENGEIEPEQETDLSVDENQGELSQYLRFFAWNDIDGDNIWESGEQKLFSNTQGPASDVLDGQVYPLYTSSTLGALPANQEKSIGLYWCFGNLTVNESNNTLSCNGSGEYNDAQTDELSTNISFYAEQARNNETFQCPPLETNQNP